MNRAERIKTLLTKQFAPVHLVVRDDSARHHGHREAGEAVESHFHITIAATVFEGKTRIERHRLVNAALADEFDKGLHALAIDAASAEEYKLLKPLI